MTTESDLTVRNEHGTIVALPTICLSLFSGDSLAAVMLAAADIIERYVKLIGSDKLAIRYDADGNDRPLTPNRYARDLKTLRNAQPRQTIEEILYDSAIDEWVGAYSVSFFGIDPNSEDAGPEEASMLILTLPFDAVISIGAHALAEEFRQMASTFSPLSYGYASYCLRRTEATSHMATGKINALITRYIGLDPSYSPMKNKMRGKTFGAHWIDFIGRPLVEKLKRSSIIADVQHAVVNDLSDGGLMIQNSKAPALGDVNRRAMDIGAMPETARALKSLRSRVANFGDPIFDAQDWLARFDDLEVADWNNAP
ncbi:MULTISPECIES: type VI immunity family protein [unclassified Mesorhizobium]|uniref:type VI immunity family protein n=1 Tax=unclassified Mesorhizobium TaxID=325217 RepID=UPI00112E4CE3|nr:MULTISPECIES: type VI immunity family protein [unclassified Mesorhizobium]MBZ9810868.1 DUF3396 domain-containing protein [Mesorhizobium sp. ESP-6-2]TPM27670.1 DUF3396 domain-containing protein [Mesorhizobium sp. B2-2-2]